MDIISNSMMKSGVQQRTPTKRAKQPKKKSNNNNIKPIKVVYISNPMKVKTSASEFMALVQELTGQNAETPPDPSRFQELESDDGSGSSGGGGGGDDKLIADNCLVKIGYDDENDHARVVPPLVDPNNNCEGQLASGESSMESFEPFDDDVFTPQMIENISAMLPESVLMQCDYIHH